MPIKIPKFADMFMKQKKNETKEKKIIKINLSQIKWDKQKHDWIFKNSTYHINLL